MCTFLILEDLDAIRLASLPSVFGQHALLKLTLADDGVPALTGVGVVGDLSEAAMTLNIDGLHVLNLNLTGNERFHVIDIGAGLKRFLPTGEEGVLIDGGFTLIAMLISVGAVLERWGWFGRAAATVGARDVTVLRTVREALTATFGPITNLNTIISSKHIGKIMLKNVLSSGEGI